MAPGLSNIANKLSTTTTSSNGSNLNNSSSYVPSPGSSIMFFLIVTTVYFFIRLFTLPSKLKPQSMYTNIIYMVIFLSILVIGNFFINISVTQKLCNGNVQWYSTFMITFIPWILIFGIINIVLIVFPGWLTPFSNTIGYYVAKIAGLNGLFVNDILEPKIDTNKIDEMIEKGSSESNIEIAKALEQIYGNETLLINEIPRDGETEEEQIQQFKDFVKIMQKMKIFKNPKDKEGHDTMEQAIAELYKMLKMKDIAAEYVWNLLCGFLVTSLSYNYVVNAGCAYSAGQMKKNYEDHLTDVGKATNIAEGSDSLGNLALAQGNLIADS